MNNRLRKVGAAACAALGWHGVVAAAGPVAGERAGELPGPLREWAGWATWDDRGRECPTPYHDPGKPLCHWPSQLTLEVDGAGGRFGLAVEVFARTWVRLPGGGEVWPLEVAANGGPVPVIEHEGGPAVRLRPGRHDLQGVFRWAEMPQRIPVPAAIGILALTLNGQPVAAPVWDAQGFLWLKRDGSTEQVDKDFLAVKLFSAIEDGIPLWLHTDVELIVAGKSREEELGVILPAGWKLAAVESPVPVAVDQAGHLKAQVRAGKWLVHVTAFRPDHPPEIAYAAGAKPAVEEQLIAFQARPEFRLVEVAGIPAIDVSQTPFPDKWRQLPVYQWDTSQPFRLDERMRGMGLQQPAGLQVHRELWLDEGGRALSFRDHISGTMQRIWRLDTAPGQQLGAVRAAGEGQLITANPTTGAAGVEVRARTIDLEATGRMSRAGAIPATGWQADADDLQVTLNLPPGWRLFALFGADRVDGDWLTAWTLLDLFLLLIFALAVLRLWGWRAAVLAFCAFGLAYHEPGAPRYAWLVLLIPLALLRVVPAGWGRRLLLGWKWINVLVLVLVLVPFLARQVQQCLYPQLEDTGRHGRRGLFATTLGYAAEPAVQARRMALPSSLAPEERSKGEPKLGQFQTSENLRYDAQAAIQVGQGVPDWTWRVASFGWNGPVKASQTVRPVLIPQPVERVLTVLRVLLLLALAAVLLDARRLGGLFRRRGADAGAGAAGAGAAGATAVLALLGWLAAAPPAPAQSPLPDQATLETLRARLNEVSDAYPTAADIPSVALALHDRKLVLDVAVHAAIRTAVPLPGRLPAWSPVSVAVDGQPASALRRDDGFLWLVLPAGVHQVRVEGLLANLTEWEWAFQLKPRRVTIDAPGWTVSGVRPDGVPEAQVFFALQRREAGGEASYDRPDVQIAAAVDRHLELGLVWQVRTTVSRLSPPGKALELRVPLLPGENVISSNMVVRDGLLEARLGAQEKEFSWQGELAPVNELALATRADDTWVERWHLVASPVWNVAISGTAPVFEADNAELVPVWHVWPGEGATLAVSRPLAIPGALNAVGSGTHAVSLGRRQRVSTLELSLRSSLGGDFPVGLPAGAEPTSLTIDGRAVPVRADGGKVVVPLHPGEQQLAIGWKTDDLLGFREQVGAVGLPVGSANVTTTLEVPQDRWVLWARGPVRGPAVRFWTILVCALLAAWVLGRVARSPLRTVEWMLLGIGLTQVPLPLALVVIGWLFFLRWRGSESFLRLPAWAHNLLQVALIAATLVALGVFVGVVAAGLLGSPEMFISGNGSSSHLLRWYEAGCGNQLPRPGCVTVSIWWYRFLMLVWALWLAAALIRWLRWAWRQFSTGGCFRPLAPPRPVPPPLTAAK